MPKVIIVGAGIAGLSAALRLLQRGFDVTLLEQDDFLGGKLGAHQHQHYHGKAAIAPGGVVTRPDDAGDAAPIAQAGMNFPGSKASWVGSRIRHMTLVDPAQRERVEARLHAAQAPASGDWHEHSYHMYVNWYQNFWDIVAEIGKRDMFVPAPTAHHLLPLRPGQQRPCEPLNITDVGSAPAFWQNMFSGLMSPTDTFLYAYSLLDVATAPARNVELLERTSVLGFLSSRPYATEVAIEQHYRTLANAFACPSYLTAMRSYKAFVGYGAREPSPMMWLLQGNADECLFRPLEQYLMETARRLEAEGAKLEIRRLTHVSALELERDRIVRLKTSTLAESPSIDSPGPLIALDEGSVDVEDGDVILAVPPRALQQLVSPAILRLAPRLGDVSQLRTLPMASLDLYFNRRIAGVPEGITLLLDSAYGLSFLDISSLWPELQRQSKTVLNIVASDAGILSSYPEHESAALILEELRRYIPFADEDIEKERTHMQSNVGEELFINQVGSWDYRPTTTCGVPNLFIAGDYCQTCVDVVTIEGAVVSGLMAAEAVRRHQGSVGIPIEIAEPPRPGSSSMTMARTMGAPVARAAKVVSDLDRAVRGRYNRLFPNG